MVWEFFAAFHVVFLASWDVKEIFSGGRSFPSGFVRDYDLKVSLGVGNKEKQGAGGWLNLLWHFSGDRVEKSEVWRRNI